MSDNDKVNGDTTSTSNYTVFLVLVLCMVIAILRFTLPTHGLQKEDIFKDVAHLFVGGLFGAALATMRWQWWALALGMTAVEIAAFVSR